MCKIGVTDMLYFVHIIGESEVWGYQQNINTTIEWDIPKNVTELKSFLDLCTYYMKFIKGFSQLKTPLTYLTKEGDFSVFNDTHETFKRMKHLRSSCHMLALLHFTHPFLLECDTLSIGIGEVLIQNQHLIAFEN